MDAREFLDAHWPSRGYYCVAIPISWIDEDTGEKKAAFKHFIYDTVGGAYKKYETLREKHDVYFAVNTLKENKTKGARVHENMAFSRSLFLDLDVEPTGKGGKYTTQKAAVGALEEFCANVGLPIPTLVSSGYGVHCYWRFDTDISVSAWLQYAELLHRLIMHWNFKADPNCIKDQSRVLRIPGGLNFKNRDAPKRVVVKHAAGEVTTTDIWGILVDACEATR